jgi:hypothetical protein
MLVRKTEFLDFYFSYEYHQVSSSEDEEPWLFAYTTHNSGILLPLLVRNIDDTDFKDATSVYGYAGPLTYGNITNKDIEAFQEEIRHDLLQNGIISVFSRLHPYLPGQINILRGLGTVDFLGRVVNVDLTLSLTEQWSHVSKRFHSYINKGRRIYNLRKATSLEDLKRFKDLHVSTMKRLNARPSYYYQEDYYEKLWNSTLFDTSILLAEDPESGEVVSAAMFIICGSIVQYHLSGTDERYLDEHPVKVLIDEMRIIANKEGLKFFNLGGGLGGSEDSLFYFKSKFSKDYREFCVWKYIVDEETYFKLSNKNLNSGCGLDPASCKTFFPCYRCGANFSD